MVVEEQAMATLTHTHTVSPVIHRVIDPRQGSDAILTHASLAPPIIKLMGYEHREDAVRGGGSRQWQTHTHTHTNKHTQPVSPVIQRMDGASGKDRTQS